MVAVFMCVFYVVTSRVSNFPRFPSGELQSRFYQFSTKREGGASLGNQVKKPSPNPSLKREGTSTAAPSWDFAVLLDFPVKIDE